MKSTKQTSGASGTRRVSRNARTSSGVARLLPPTLETTGQQYDAYLANYRKYAAEKAAFKAAFKKTLAQSRAPKSVSQPAPNVAKAAAASRIVPAAKPPSASQHLRLLEEMRRLAEAQAKAQTALKHAGLNPEKAKLPDSAWTVVARKKKTAAPKAPKTPVHERAAVPKKQQVEVKSAGSSARVQASPAAPPATPSAPQTAPPAPNDLVRFLQRERIPGLSPPAIAMLGRVWETANATYSRSQRTQALVLKPQAFMAMTDEQRESWWTRGGAVW